MGLINFIKAVWNKLFKREIAEGKALCFYDMDDFVNVNSPACDYFEYDDSFVKK